MKLQDCVGEFDSTDWGFGYADIKSKLMEFRGIEAKWLTASLLYLDLQRIPMTYGCPIMRTVSTARKCSRVIHDCTGEIRRLGRLRPTASFYYAKKPGAEIRG